MFKNGLGNMGLKSHKFVDMPKKCEQCGTTMKNPKKYYLSRVSEKKSGYWSIGKVCKVCNHENFSAMGDE